MRNLGWPNCFDELHAVAQIDTDSCKTIDELHEKANFVEITSAGVRESHVHDVKITKEAPNYHID